MEISILNTKNFKLKTKTTTVVTGDKFMVGEFEITGPGEYEVNGVSVVGTPRGFVIEADNLRICLITKTDAKLSDSEVEEFGSIDITLVPTDGDVKMAQQIAKQVDPWVMIPNNFNVTEFLKEMGTASYEPVPKYTISHDKLPQELQVICLK